MDKDNYRIKKTIENERKLNEISHTTKEANKYFAKLRYIVNNFEKLEKRIERIEEKLIHIENIKEEI